MLKQKFPILRGPLPYRDTHFQSQIIASVFFLWNFVLDHEDLPDNEDKYVIDEDNDGDDDDEDERHQGSQAAARWRDSIAERMWQDYRRRIQ